ncbi:YcjF family protein [Streptococcus parauberis]|uniref:GTPase domain-containing protein n=3 Tax=Streptococcus parauberis TaxID=1348 RepID=F1Z043_9STRE|nr:DUF697 domain-containing protein [Streptococcus parauberis]AEF25185.1 GTPase domain-containing protein [Streptococcus parauberis KCTC 11537]AUT06090.1 hypothetical protein SPSF3K_01365 [Streptococcus parauberis]EGE53251.1 hypothetical protein SPB_0565 [Streptococcus parauberis NCFD 2020]EMG26013.1 Uncharacterized protein/domain associated with GTPase [Streptococcus parauberis KRS-02083]KYP16961.1 hypothetical protein AKL14_02009 [Streptococcus parauberis]
MTIVQKETAMKAVHTASVAAAGVALSPIPFSDAMLLVPIQTMMITNIFKAYGQSTTRGLVSGVVQATTATTLGRTAVTSIIKFVPGIGTVVGALIGSGVAVAITESIGQKLINQFEEHGSVDTESLKSIIKTVILKKIRK